MLKSLLIQNIVLVDRLEIEMVGGFCVLSGETGSGKSILLDALGLATGERSNSRLLKTGSKQGLVVAEFDIQNNQLCQDVLSENALINDENENSLILKRILLDSGVSKAFANDIPIGVNLLKQIGASLIEIHGQHQQKGLLNPSYHKVILDQYANLGDLLKSVNGAFDDWQNIEKRIARINSQKDQNERERDYLSHIAKELEVAAIEVGEEDRLVDQKSLLANKEKIAEISQELATNINDADDKFSSAQNLLIRNQDLGEGVGEEGEENKLAQLTEIVDQIISQSDKAKELLNSIFSSFEESEISLEEVEERLFLIRNLSRKFNIRVDELPQFLQETQEKLEMAENFQAISEQLNGDAAIAKEKYLKLAKELSELRGKVALKLSAAVEGELAYLKMGSVKFVAQVASLDEANYGRDGIDKIRFIAATNHNAILDDISKIASGGELSRFMLALKVALSEVQSTPILIFDEIDTGIGGAVADSVGERLKLLSKNLQIMVVTHHAQIAAKADYNLRVSKRSEENGGNALATKVKVETLDSLGKAEEVARMLSGENISDEAVAAARKLIAG